MDYGFSVVEGRFPIIIFRQSVFTAGIFAVLIHFFGIATFTITIYMQYMIFFGFLSLKIGYQKQILGNVISLKRRNKDVCVWKLGYVFSNNFFKKKTF